MSGKAFLIPATVAAAGLAIGLALRSAGSSPASAESSGSSSAVTVTPREPSSASSWSRRASARPQTVTITQTQADLLLEKPTRFQLPRAVFDRGGHRFDQWAASMQEFFALTPEQSQTLATDLKDFTARLSTLIASDALYDDSVPGLVRIDLSPVAASYQTEVDAFFKKLRSNLGNSGFKKIKRLAKLPSLRDAINSQASSTVKVTRPTSNSGQQLFDIDFIDLDDSHKNLSLAIRGRIPEELFGTHILLNDIDWPSVLKRIEPPADP